MKRGIVGHAAEKFTPETEKKAKQIIQNILLSGDILVSGHCHLKGIDIWAEEEAKNREDLPEPIIHKPKSLQWSGGYRERNIKIAKDSDIVHVIVVSKYPPKYHGMRFKECYHCYTDSHIKSGGCWTANKAIGYGKPAIWHIIKKDSVEVIIK